MSVIIIDLETIPDQSPTAMQDIAETIKPPAQMKKTATIDDWHKGNGKYAGEKEKAINEKWLKTSFDGGYGQICCICIDVDGEQLTFISDASEESLLKCFWSTIDSLSASPYFVAHNAKFDLPFLWHRSIINGVVPHKFFKAHGRHNSDYFCTMEAWAGWNGKIGLDRLAKILGLGSKTEGMDGSQVWPEYQKGNIQKIAGYCMDDVRLTKAIYERLTIK